MVHCFRHSRFILPSQTPPSLGTLSINFISNLWEDKSSIRYRGVHTYCPQTLPPYVNGLGIGIYWTSPEPLGPESFRVVGV